MSPLFLHEIPEGHALASEELQISVSPAPLPEVVDGRPMSVPCDTTERCKISENSDAKVIHRSGNLYDICRKPKPRQNEGLRVTFEKGASTIIGKGGDKAVLPTKDVTLGYREFKTAVNFYERRDGPFNKFLGSHVRFAPNPPEIIGEGGENATLPPRDVERRYQHFKSASCVHILQEAFRLLDLPPEIRNIIYWKALPLAIRTTESIPIRFQSADCILRKRSYANLTLTNRQVRREALYALFQNKAFVIPAGVQNCKVKNWPLLTPSYLKLAVKNKFFAHGVRNVVIEVTSIEAKTSITSMMVPMPQVITNMSWICHYLPIFENIQRIIVLWDDYPNLSDYTPLGTSYHYSMYWRPNIGAESRLAALRPLQQYQEQNPGTSLYVCGRPYTRESSAPEMRSEPITHHVYKHKGIMSLKLWLQAPENEKWQRESLAEAC